MILQALTDYYYRKANDTESDIAPKGFEWKEIPFVIVLDEEGNFIQIEDTRYHEGKRLRSQRFLVPQGEKRTSGPKANLLWDNVEYIFGIPIKGKPERVAEQQHLFFNRILSLDLGQDRGINAVLTFLKNSPAKVLGACEYAEEIKLLNPFMAFKLHKDTCLINERQAIVDKILSTLNVGMQGTCLITGKNGVLANLHPAIKGIRGTVSSGGNIVSFNAESFNSYGKLQGSNAPISEIAAVAYTTALNHLLSKDSSQKIQVGDVTVIFWAERKSIFETDFATLFDEPPKDNPDRLTSTVKALFSAAETGVMPIEDATNRFFILGLSPNAARISIRFWHAGNIATLLTNIKQHFFDLTIEHAPYERNYLSIWEMLRSTSILGKAENISPILAGDWMRTILSGLPYPNTLFQAVLRRITAEREVTYARTAILKAYLNRKARFQLSQEKEIAVLLDRENKNLGYRLGRLFAILEKIQEEANPGINATIRDRYYSAVSGTPASVMPILLRLKNHHLNKLEGGRTIYFERQLMEVIGDVNDFPKQLDLQDQGRFAIGYYHQCQSFFTKTETKSQGEHA